MRNPQVIACSTHFRHSQTLACSLLLKLCVFLGFPRVFPFRASTTGPCCTMPSPLVPWTCVLPGMDYSVPLFYDLKLRATCRRSTSVVPCSHCAACSYAMTSVPFWTYFWATWLGLAPGTFAYVYLGSAVRSKACLCTPQHPCAHLSMRRWVHGTGLSSAIFSANMSQCSICAQCSMKPPCTEHTFHLTQQLAQCVACPPGRPAPHRGPPCEGLRGVLAGAEPGRCGVRAAFGRPRVLHGACIGGLRHVRSGHLFNARGTEPCPQASWQAYGVRVCVVRGDVAGIEYPHGCGTGIPHECMAMGVSGTHEGVHWNADMPFAAASVCASVPWWCRLSSHWVLGRMRAPGLRSQLVLQQLL